MEQQLQPDSLAMPLTPVGLHEDEFELEILRFELHPAHRLPTYQFQMLHRETREVLGNIRLSIGSTDHLVRYGGHIGYGVLPQHRGHHYAARAVHLLVPFARRLGIDPLWITCDPKTSPREEPSTSPVRSSSRSSMSPPTASSIARVTHVSAAIE